MEPGDLRYPHNCNAKLSRMLNDDVIRIKSNLRALAEAQSDIKEYQRKLGQAIQYYESSIPNLRQKKAAFAATFASTFSHLVNARRLAFVSLDGRWWAAARWRTAMDHRERARFK